MEKQKIYLPLQGRIGNQLFQYAFARRIQREMGETTEIIIDDSDVILQDWENSLVFYDLPNVRYVHQNIIENNKYTKQYFLRKIYRIFTRKQNYMKKYLYEEKLQKILNKNGMFICENGYIRPEINYKKPVYLEGYFQSEKYFLPIKKDILNLLNGSRFSQLEEYPGLEKVRNRNSVCISIKIEHNVGSSMYSVCTLDYWKKAIEYIIKNVDNPLFFICSDDVEYVINNLIDISKFEYITQDRKMPVHVSLAAMSECKHFIIGNTTFGWWAQYMSEYKEKIVVAPMKWMAIDMPIDIYQDNWHLVEV